MNRCFVTFYIIHSHRKNEINKKLKSFIEQNKEIDASQIIQKLPLPFIKGELAPPEYFYSLFTIEELNSEDFMPKIFLVIDKELDGKYVKIGKLIIVKLLYIDLEGL